MTTRRNAFVPTQTTETPLAFLDVKTAQFIPSTERAEHYSIWSVGAILVAGESKPSEQHWFLPFPLGHADTEALRAEGFNEIYPVQSLKEWPLRDWPNQMQLGEGLTHPYEFGREFASLTRGCTLISLCAELDAELLDSLLRAYGSAPEWQLHALDIEAMAYGFVHGRAAERQSRIELQPPVEMAQLADALGLDLSKYEGDLPFRNARFAHDAYHRMTQGG